MPTHLNSNRSCEDMIEITSVIVLAGTRQCQNIGIRIEATKTSSTCLLCVHASSLDRCHTGTSLLLYLALHIVTGCHGYLHADAGPLFHGFKPPAGDVQPECMPTQVGVCMTTTTAVEQVEDIAARELLCHDLRFKEEIYSSLVRIYRTISNSRTRNACDPKKDSSVSEGGIRRDQPARFESRAVRTAHDIRLDADGMNLFDEIPDMTES